jgi:hypothetical protein
MDITKLRADDGAEIDEIAEFKSMFKAELFCGQK